MSTYEIVFVIVGLILKIIDIIVKVISIKNDTREKPP